MLNTNGYKEYGTNGINRKWWIKNWREVLYWSAYFDYQIADIKKSQLKAEKDIVRSQLLVLMSDYPENQPEIMETMKHYHVDLNGNWYSTSLFKKWCDKNDIDIPKWLD